MDLVNKVTLESDGRLVHMPRRATSIRGTTMTTRGVSSWRRFKWFRTLWECQLSVATELVRRVEERVPIYSRIYSRGRPEIAFPRLRRPGTGAPIL